MCDIIVDKKGKQKTRKSVNSGLRRKDYAAYDTRWIPYITSRIVYIDTWGGCKIANDDIYST